VTENNQILDTVEIALIKKGVKTNVRSGGIILALRAKNNVTNKSSYDYFKPVTIEFSNPIASFDFSKVIIIENKDTIKPLIDFNYAVAGPGDSILRKFTINNTWKEGTNYSIRVLPAAFRDVFNLPNDTVKIDFKTAEQKDYGNVVFKITTEKKYENLLVQLVNNDDVVMAENPLQKDGTVSFNFIRPSTYKVKLIVDSNNNGKWDTGNYLKNIQPEKVFYDPTAFEIKANWDIELDWIVEE